MNNTTSLARQDEKLAEVAEQAIVGGDLTALTASQRVSYYHKVCESVGLNPFTRPFEYIKLNGKLTLYAKRDATDQLRTIHGISLSKPNIEYIDDLVVVTIEAINRHGRTDTDLGAVNCKGLQGEAKANAMMKAITKAKRRVTLSLAGMGWLDETEIDAIPDAQRVTVDTSTGEILEPAKDIDFYESTNGTATGNPFDAETPYYVTAWNQLSGKNYDLVNWIRQLHAKGEPCSDKQYGFVVALVDALTNNEHNYALSVLCQSEISKSNMPSKEATSALLKFLQKEINAIDENGNEIKGDKGKPVKVPNPQYRQDMAAMVTDIAAQIEKLEEQAQEEPEPHF